MRATQFDRWCTCRVEGRGNSLDVCSRCLHRLEVRRTRSRGPGLIDRRVGAVHCLLAGGQKLSKHGPTRQPRVSTKGMDIPIMFTAPCMVLPLNLSRRETLPSTAFVKSSVTI